MSAGAKTDPDALPAPLPAGERILWQGSPEPWSLARRAFHVRKIALYFLAMLAWRVVATIEDGASLAGAIASAVWLLPLALGGLALVAMLAYFAARTTIYTVTNRRVVMRIGIALPMTLNIPFRIVGSVALKANPDGTGDIPLALQGSSRAAYLVLWPHARPWRIARPEPMLRSIPEAARVARLLGAAMAEVTPGIAAAPVDSRRPAGLGDAAPPLDAAAA